MKELGSKLEAEFIDLDVWVNIFGNIRSTASMQRKDMQPQNNLILHVVQEAHTLKIFVYIVRNVVYITYIFSNFSNFSIVLRLWNVWDIYIATFMAFL